MEEKDLFIRYIESHGSKVKDVIYHYEEYDVEADTVTYVGKANGYIKNSCFLFGNVSVNTLVEGVITLGLANKYSVLLSIEFGSRTEPGSIEIINSIGDGLNLLGDGRYQGVKRVYGVGFNNLIINSEGIQDAIWETKVVVNGFLYILR